MKILYNSLLAVAILCSSGCTTPGDLLNKDYVAADRATYEALAPSYLDYVDGDESLDSDEKKRRARTIETWRFRLEQAEKPIGPDAE